MFHQNEDVNFVVGENQFYSPADISKSFKLSKSYQIKFQIIKKIYQKVLNYQKVIKSSFKLSKRYIKKF